MISANITASLYLVTGILFIMALRGLSSPETSRTGNFLGILGMTLAVIVTLLSLGDINQIKENIIYILVPIILGGLIGGVIAFRVSMTAMPQLVAGFHSLVGLSAVLVGIVASIGSYPLSSINEQALFLALGFALISFTYAGYKINVRNKKELARQAYNLQIAQKNEELKRQNYQTTVIAVKECQKKIYEQWLQDMLEATYMAKRNDVLGRWSSAVSTTIDQVVQKLFIDRQSQAQQWQEKQTSREELEKVLAQRSSEMFG